MGVCLYSQPVYANKHIPAIYYTRTNSQDEFLPKFKTEDFNNCPAHVLKKLKTEDVPSRKPTDRKLAKELKLQKKYLKVEHNYKKAESDFYEIKRDLGTYETNAYSAVGFQKKMSQARNIGARFQSFLTHWRDTRPTYSDFEGLVSSKLDALLDDD